MKKILISVMAIALLCMACQESIEERTARECEEFTRKYCPNPISETVVQDSMVYHADSRTVEYYYSLRGDADDANVIAQRLEESRKATLEGIRTNTQIQVYKDAGFILKYTYFSTKNPKQKLAELTFKPEEYR